MTLLAQAAAFALGAYLSVRMIAALHIAVDLWYDIRKWYPRVIGNIVAWEAAILICVGLMEFRVQTAFLYGFSIYLAFYLSLLPLFGLFVRLVRSDRHFR